MYVIQEAKTQVLQAIKQAVGQGYAPSVEDLEHPPNPKMGDIAFPCFTLASKLKRNPTEVAVEIAASIGPKGYIADVKAVGPYVNIKLDTNVVGSALLQEIHELMDEYGASDVGQDKRIMVEFANLNTHKDVHIGHLRNIFIGQAVVNILKITGYDVIPVAYINDLGLHVAKSVWCIKTNHGSEEIAEKNRIAFLRNVYIEATNLLERQPSLESQVSQVFRHLEKQRGDEIAIWKQTRAWSIDYLKSVYNELHLTIDHWYFESELIGKTKKIIDDLIKKGIVKESEGAWIVDLKDQNLGVNLLVRSDSSLLYNAKDLALALKKEEDYHPIRSIYVVDTRQSLAMQQLFATLKMMGFERELYHLSYEFVTLEGGAMAARKGNVIPYEELRDEVFEEARRQTQARHPDWSTKKINTTSRAISSAAVRFGMLKQDTTKKIVFNLQGSLSFDGFTGSYLLYSYARVRSLLKKAGRKRPTWSATTLQGPHIHELLMTMSRYPDVVFDAGQRLEPALLSQYLFDLAKHFSDFYENVPVLKTEGIALAERLALVRAVGIILKNGLELLGIETIDEM